MKNINYIFLLIVFFVASSFSNGDISDNCRLAILSGNAKELTSYFDKSVELRTEKEEGSYSKSQAELVLKNFFKSNPALKFNYVHKGTSPGGAKYAIGSYTSNNGVFRVYIKMKMVSGQYLIDTLDISEE